MYATRRLKVVNMLLFISLIINNKFRKGLRPPA